MPPLPPYTIFAISGPLVGITGGDLCNANIVETLGENFEIRAIHDSCPASLNRLPFSATFKGLLANFVNSIRRFPRRSILVVDHGEALNLFASLHVWRIIWRVQVIYTAYHLEFNVRAGLARHIRRLIERSSVLSADHLVTISECTKRQLREMAGPNTPITVVPTIIPGAVRPPPSNRPPSTAFRFLFVGVVQPRKGLDFALRALRAGTWPQPIEFHVAGAFDPHSSYGAALLSLASSVEGVRVQFLGRLSEEQLQEEFASADAFLFPSLWEGFGIAVVEAMQHGLPVVAFDAGALGEIIQNGRTGWLVSTGDETALREAMQDCVSDAGKRRRFSAAAVARAAEISKPNGPGPAVREIVRGLIPAG